MESSNILLAMQAASPMSMDTHTKSSGTTEHGLIKKLKGHDDLAMSIGNGRADSSEGEMERTLSQRFANQL